MFLGDIFCNLFHAPINLRRIELSQIDTLLSCGREVYQGSVDPYKRNVYEFWGRHPQGWCIHSFISWFGSCLSLLVNILAVVSHRFIHPHHQAFLSKLCIRSEHFSWFVYWQISAQWRTQSFVLGMRNAYPKIFILQHITQYLAATMPCGFFMLFFNLK